MSIEVREALPDEHPAIGALTVRAYRLVDQALGAYEAHLRDVSGRAANAVILVALRDGAVAGGVTYVPGPGPMAEWDDPDAAGIRMLAVAPEHQGHGIGAALVRACMQRARAEGRPRLVLHTTDFMPAAARLYVRLGFRRADELDWEPEPGFWLRGFVRELDEGLLI